MMSLRLVIKVIVTASRETNSNPYGNLAEIKASDLKGNSVTCGWINETRKKK